MSDALASARKLVRVDLLEVQQLFEQALASPVRTLDAIGKHLVESEGKGFRGLLCLLAGRATGVPPLRARVVAAAAELTHAASLCHDDVLDRGEVRRGRPSVRARFGDAASILLGDLCVTGAFGLLARAGLDRSGEALARVVRSMAEGEVLQGERVGDAEASVEDQLAIAEAKSGALLAWCSTVGELAPAPEREALRRYGLALGRAYQVVDDVLDLDPAPTADEDAGQDLRRGTVTVPVILAASSSPELAGLLFPAVGRSPAASDRVAELIRRTGAIGQSRDLARAEAERAREALAGVTEGAERKALEDLARFAAERSS